MPNSVSVFGIGGIDEVRPGDDLVELLLVAAKAQGTPIQSGDVLVVTQKVVSKAEGRLVRLKDVVPSQFASAVAGLDDRDPRYVEVILREARRIIRMDHGVIITETHHGFRCANSGVDASNMPKDGEVALLPEDPDASALAIRSNIQRRNGHDVAVIVSDTFGRPWREGAVNVAIGIAGLEPILDYRGQEDDYGHVLQTTAIAVADELASAAELVTNKSTRIPAAIIRGYSFRSAAGGVQSLLRQPAQDLFR